MLMKISKQCLVSLSAGVAALSLLAPQAAFASIDDGIQMRVSNGKQASECHFPAVVKLSNCTGTLVHPKLVVYAAHCGKRQTVTLTHGSGGAKLAVERCNTNPRYGSASQEHLDWAYCILKEPAKDWPIIPVAAGCEMDMLAKSGGEVVQCGFGRSNDGGPSFGRKRFAVSKISRVSKAEITVGDHGGVVACPGDSGGPLLARLEDGSWRTIGITSTYNGRCGSGGMNTYANIAGALAWIEKDSGIDITPCFNSKQEWEPGPGCGGFFAAEMDKASGSWSNACKGTELSGLSTTCGSQGPDEEAPKVTLKATNGESQLEEGGSVTIEAEAKDNVKVSSVELFMDGDSQGKLDKAPFSWKVEDLEAGDVEFKAVALDEAKNEGKSEVIELKVKGNKEEEKSNEASEGEDEGTKKKSEDEDSKKSEDEDSKKKSEDEGSSDDDDDSSASKDAAKKAKDKAKEKTGCRVDNSSSGSAFALLALLGLMRQRRRSNKHS